MASTDAKPLTIGAVCRLLQQEFDDISISKIRYLEDQELIHPQRTRGGYRLFGPDEVERLRSVLRMQRDDYLPLRVIREELDGSQSPVEERRERRRRRPEMPGATGAERVRRAELVQATGVDDDLLRDLEEYNVVRAARDGTYAADDVEIVRTCMRIGQYGMGARHVRHIHSSVERAAGLVEQVLGASLRSRNVDRREDGLVQLAEIAALAADLTERVLVRDVRDATA